jgi:hypothetical protein
VVAGREGIEGHARSIHFEIDLKFFNILVRNPFSEEQEISCTPRSTLLFEPVLQKSYLRKMEFFYVKG